MKLVSIKYFPLFSIVFLLIFSSCKKEVMNRGIYDPPYLLKIPYGFSYPNIPNDNKLTEYRVALGKKLFYDKSLSSTGLISCASCHIPEHAFSDTVPLSRGVHGRLGMRNSPSLANVAYKDAFFADGGIPTLELQVLAPIQDENEMDMDFLMAVEKMKENPFYIQYSKIAYNREPDGFVLTRAISSFERTLISGDSKYDKYVKGEVNLSESESRGEQLFFSSRTNCSSCHSGNTFSNFHYENIGLHQTYSDSGRMRVTLQESDRNKFVTPTLRNIAVTYPYMHDGSLQTLREVIDFFNSGGYPHANKSLLIKPLSLSEQEKIDLESFLRSLTDETFLNNEHHIEK